MTISQPADAADPHPSEKLRLMLTKQIDELASQREKKELSIADHERFAKALIAITKLVEQLFAAEEGAPARKTGDELKKEDDAIRAEFARRLAAMLRGRQIAAGAERDQEGTLAEASS